MWKNYLPSPILKSSRFIFLHKQIMMNFKLVAFAIVVAVFAISCEKNTELEPDTSSMDNIQTPGMLSADNNIPGEYIVVYNELPGNRPDAWEQGIERAREVTRGVLDEFRVPAENLGYVYAYVIEGFSAKLTDEQVSRLERDRRIKYIEPNQKMSISGSQSNATWGLDRIDLHNLPLNNTYTWDATGNGVNAYIIDSGILYSNQEFGGRAKFAYDAFEGDGVDRHGHGTHVAGTVGGDVYGVAKNTSLFGVKVLDDDGSGWVSTVVAGMDWVTAHHKKPAVANLSLGGGGNTTLDQAVENMFNAGVAVIVAAGNNNADASGYSPARAARAYTVGATTDTDARASFSNYGDRVDMFAPGSRITSAWIGSNTATRTVSGTSMASPHVAGGAALFLEHNPNATPQQVYDALTANSTKNIVTSSSTTNNHMFYTLGFGDGSQEPPPANNQDPVADFTFTTDDLTANFDAGKSYDPDGSIQRYDWNFGNGSTGTGVTTSHTYAADGTYNVTLTVTDNEGAKNSTTQSVAVTKPEPKPEPEPEPEPEDTPPAIDTFTFTSRATGPWSRVAVNWSVSDLDGNLSSVVVELLNGSSVVDSVTTGVNGSSASGDTEVRNRGNTSAVRLTVTDSKGNVVSETKSIN